MARKSKDLKEVTAEAMREQVDDFLNMTQDARELSEKCRDYYDGYQWTEDQVAELRRRKQAPIVNNRIKVKLQGLLGFVSMRKTDPRAFPRTRKHEQGAEAATDGLKYVADNSDFDSVRIDFSDNFFCEGYGGASIGVEQRKDGEIEVVIEHLPWDRIYFDPHSRAKDFKDARYLGTVQWLDEEEISEMFPDFDTSLLTQQHGNGDETLDDRPKWIMGNKNRKRYMIAHHFYMHKGVWHMCIFSNNEFLLKPAPSPWLDEFGEPQPNIELMSCYVDRENNRRGEVASFLDLQDEINHRRSKALHILSRRQTFASRGAVADPKKLKSEMAKADGHIEVDTGEFGKDFGILPTDDMAAAQFNLLQEAKAEIDAQSFNAQLSGERQSGDLSGRAIEKLQTAGTVELNSLFQRINKWELNVYRQVWARIKQFWTEEKWIRVTDDQDKLRWVGFNSQVTMKDLLEETMMDKSLPKETRLGASAQMILLEQTNPQMLDQVVETRNAVPELDMDIILDLSFDSINAQKEQFDLMLQFGAQQGIDIIDLIELSQIRGKDELIERIERRRQDAAEATQAQTELAVGEQQAKVQETSAKAALSEQKAAQMAIENQLLVASPQPVTSVAV